MSVKTRFVRFLQKLLLRLEPGTAEPQPLQPRVQASLAPVARPKPAPSPFPKPSPTPIQRPDPPTSPAPDGDVELPLVPILEKLPADLRGRITMPLAELGEASISISAAQILPQLAGGAVRVAFGQLRGAAPTLFSVGEDYDSISISLPLDLVLARLNRRWLSRVGVRKKIETPQDVGSVFIRRSAEVAPVAAPSKQSVVTAPPQREVFAKATPAAPAKTSPPAAPTPQIASPETQFKLRMVPVAPASPAAPAAPSPVPVAVRSPAPAPAAVHSAPRTPTVQPIPIRPAAPAASLASARSPASLPGSPAVQPASPEHGHPAAPSAPVAPVRSISPAAPSALPPAAVPAPSAPGTLSVPLAALTEKWPDALRHELAQHNLATATVALPLDAVEAGLKRGIVVLFWRELRTRIQPTPLTAVSIHDGAALELPLKAVAPLFISQKGLAARSRSAAELDQAIPDLFLSRAQKTPAPAPPAEPAPAASKPVGPKKGDTNFYVWDDANDRTVAEPAEAKPVETRLEPRDEAKPAEPALGRGLPPRDIIRQAMELKGVAGAMVVLHDGLMVACELPPYLNADAAAAFLPQIYDRLSQTAAELRMGALTQLRFNLGNVSWQVFRLNSVFFAVFGRQGETPPETDLASLAAELDRNRQ